MRVGGVAVTVVVAVSGCSATGPEGRPERGSAPSASIPSSDAPTPRPKPITAPTLRSQPNQVDAVVRAVPPRQWRQMVAADMVRPECPIQHRDQLRRVDVNHHDFRGQVQRGHLVVNRDVAGSVARIFTRLFDAGFPIRRMASLETYDGENAASLRADNTAAFNCRQPEENNSPFADSPHANGRAIDINPVENPWLELRCDCWSPGPRFAPRTPGRGKILQGGVVWRAFRDEGWIWQNIDVPDYMHFDTGYPSRPYRRP